MYENDPSGDLATVHSLGRYRHHRLVTTEDPERAVGIPTFLRAPMRRDLPQARLGIVGIPHDGGVVRTPGTRFGPRGIRNACWRCPVYHPQLDVAWPEHEMVADCGDLNVSPMRVADALQTIDAGISSMLAEGLVPVSVGGDHGITYPIMHAMHRVHGKFAVVHFDAHTDTQKGGLTHGTMFRYAVEEEIIRPDRFIQIGIRKTYSASEFDLHREHGMEVITADELKEMGTSALADHLRRLDDSKVYVTFDMDFVDQAYAPGTGSPEAGGPTSGEALECIRALQGLDIIGFDLVEVAPPYDVRDLTCYLANLVLLEMVSVYIATEREGSK